MDTNAKVLQICSYYTGTKLYHRLFSSLSEINANESVYVFTHDYYNLLESTNYDITISKCYNKFDRLFFHLKHIKVLKDIIIKFDINRFDILHAHSLFSNGYIAYKLNKKYNIPYIVAVRNTDVNVFFKRMICFRKLGVEILKNADKIIFISEPYKEQTISQYVPLNDKKNILLKSTVIPNGIDDFWLSNKYESRKNPEKNKLKIIYVGEINKNKNIDTTIKACKLLLTKGYDVSYTIIGKIIDKKYNKILKKYNFINYLPFCNKEELINHYRKADIFVMPSKHETFGLVYAEAMSQGLPVIYTRGQGFDKQFNEGEVGYSVLYNAAEEIAKNVINILQDYQKLSESCLSMVNKFDWARIALQYMEIYNV